MNLSTIRQIFGLGFNCSDSLTDEAIAIIERQRRLNAEWRSRQPVEKVEIRPVEIPEKDAA